MSPDFNDDFFNSDMTAMTAFLGHLWYIFFWKEENGSLCQVGMFFAILTHLQISRLLFFPFHQDA
jgi:hypothetical protein